MTECPLLAGELKLNSSVFGNKTTLLKEKKIREREKRQVCVAQLINQRKRKVFVLWWGLENDESDQSVPVYEKKVGLCFMNKLKLEPKTQIQQSVEC